MRFNYLEPKTVEEAVSLLNKHNSRANIIAGGTDLLLKIRDNAVSPKYVIDISDIPELDYIKYDEDQQLRIGAATTLRTLEKSDELREKYPLIFQAVSQLGSIPIRNVATIGGNLCNASPSAETAPALIGYSAKIRAISHGGERIIALEEFFAGPCSTALKAGELMVEVIVPVPQPKSRGAYLKHSIRGTIGPAIVGVAVLITMGCDDKVCRDIKIVLGGVAPTVIRAFRAEELLKGRQLDKDLIAQSAELATNETEPISDVRASAEYRREMIRVLTNRAIMESLVGLTIK